ncbi:hypothetical protein EDD86DRAFT_194143 [Gorgonomyces haynaldii]|nr:hypothetical protein EDD86DRAFT_194143 [Gorgonomyces haynaldii]
MPNCLRCQKAVYFVEQQTGPSGVYHKQCFNCKTCSKKLDSTNLTDKDGEIYCKTCYGRLFGPKGYGYNNTLSTESKITANFGSSENIGQKSASTEDLKPRFGSSGNLSKGDSKEKLGSGSLSDKCPKCQKTVYFAEQMLGPGNSKYHKLCFTCSDCGKSVDSRTMADKDNVLYCKGCHGRKFGPKGFGVGLTTEGPA